MTAYGYPSYTGSMSPKAPRKDVNQLAAAILEEASGGKPVIGPPEGVFKDPAAVALGRRGGLKGGKARAEALSPKKRKDIAKKAAQARWSDHRKK